MDVNIPTLVIIALFILIALMAFIAIILSFINWLHTRRGMRLFAEIPKRLSLPLSQEERVLMRSWYSGEEYLHEYIREMPLGSYPLPPHTTLLDAGTIRQSAPCLPGLSGSSLIPAGNCWRPLSDRTCRALQNPTEPVREAQMFMVQISEAIRQFEGESDGVDREAEISHLRE